MKSIIFGLVLLTASNVSAQDKLQVPNHLVLSGYAVAAFVDTATTEYGLGKGTVHEANPIQKYFTDKGPVWSGIAKGSMHVGIGYILLRNHKDHGKLTLISGCTLLALQVIVDVSNARTIGKN